MVFDRPNRPNPPQRPSINHPSSVSQSSASKPTKKIITVGGGNGSSGSGNGGNNGGNGSPPSPWLGETPSPDRSASFVEYLRWMRSKSEDKQVDSGTILDLFSRFESNNFSELLNRRINTTRKIAHEWFEAKCSWRIRVGGIRGPESMLLPAFDSLGMPYIPASTLRGVARDQAIRQYVKDENLRWEEAEQRVAAYFGSLQAEGKDRNGKIIFLDAYPLPGVNNKGGLQPDMANAIWKWSTNHPPEYNTNPNLFISLEKPIMIIGLCKGRGCDEHIFQKVKGWLVNGLAQGIGSRVNSGYGGLDFCKNTLFLNDSNIKIVRKKTIIAVDFKLKGQLIHGRQKFNGWQRNNQGNGWKPPGIAETEIRAIAFRSMLRYWFRAFALGILAPSQVRELEMEIFGGIDGAVEPKYTGLFRIELTGKIHRDNAKPNRQGQDDPSGLILGKLVLRNSSQTSKLSDEKKSVLDPLLKNLTWLMFRLGGVGQGARRPCYSRKTRERAPWWRGSTLHPDSDDQFWALPKSVEQFQQMFQHNLRAFYEALEKFSGQSIIGQSPRTIGSVSRNQWAEAVDSNCRIIVCTGKEEFGKPYGLAILHHSDFKVSQDYDGNLCGQVRGGVKPSPVWVSDLGAFQVVTVFGATQDPRKKYVEALRDRTSPENYAQIFPLV